MKQIVIQPTLREYREYIKKDILKNDIWYTNNFYRWLIDFIIDHRSPLFYEQSFEYEKSHFTQYRNFCIKRNYENSYLSDMYYLHDFVHMLFEYPMHVKNHSVLSFYEKLVLNEQIASNETEIYTYYRLPQVREKTFPHPIFYDSLLATTSSKLSFEELLGIRIIIAKMGYCIIDWKEINDETTKFISKFWHRNIEWTEMRYANYPVVDLERTSYTYLSLNNYEKCCEDYVSVDDEARYQHNILTNCRNLWKLLLISDDALPTTFEDCQSFVDSIPQDAVIMQQAAKDFHYWVYTV